MRTLRPATRFELPDELSASEPPESRGVPRDGVRLLVADGTSPVRHAHFRDLGAFLEPGDLLVVNTSGTLAAAVDAVRSGGVPVTVHFSTELDDGSWVVEFRHPDASPGPVTDLAAGERAELPGGHGLTVRASHPDPAQGAGSRLWACTVDGGPVPDLLSRHGRPIAYHYLHGHWPLTDYQTVFARTPGSAEMPSAGRPFTAELVTDLVTRGIGVAPVLLHTGVSSQESHEPPLGERFHVPTATARAVGAARRAGGRVIAVGTTVTRALESVARPDGSVTAGGGWTELVLGPGRPARVVDGIVSGLHTPEASHLLLLEAVVGPDVVAEAYAEALHERYLWHEFGDSSLLLKPRAHAVAQGGAA